MAPLSHAKFGHERQMGWVQDPPKFKILPIAQYFCGFSPCSGNSMYRL